MTDEQIVKALKTLDDALALIKRQQAEIEKLNKVKVFNFTVSDTKEIMPILFCHEKELKNEAVKEFAEKYKTEVTNRYEDIAYKDLFFGVIDNLVKEMTEEKK